MTSTGTVQRRGPPHLRGAHPRLPDERPRLRAHGRTARGGRLRAAPATMPRAGGRRRRRQHLRGPGERGQPAVREPRASSPSVKASRPGMQIAVGGCLAQKDRAAITAARPGSTSSSARTTSAHCRCCSSGPGTTRGTGGDRRVAAGLPLDAADPARVGLRRLGVDQRRLQQHLHLLHRAEPARHGEWTAARARSSPRSAALVGDGAIEVTLLGQNVNSYGVEFGDRDGVRVPAARRAGRSTASSGSASPPRTRRRSPTT